MLLAEVGGVGGRIWVFLVVLCELLPENYLLLVTIGPKINRVQGGAGSAHRGPRRQRPVLLIFPEVTRREVEFLVGETTGRRRRHHE